MSEDYAAVALLGVLVGVGELVSRYRDEPGRAIITIPALLYVCLNAMVALAALALIDAYGWTFGSQPSLLRLTRVLVAGLGGMALFRSSLFTVRVGTEDVGIGPSSIVQVFLTATDRAVDRKRGTARDTLVRRLMANVSFEKAFEALPAYCLALMQNLPKEDQEALGRQISLIRSGQMNPTAKALLLGLALMNVVGEDVLEAAVKSLGNTVKEI